MIIRADVADLLRAGHSNAAIARQTGIDPQTAASARVALGLPKHRPGRTPATSVEELFRARAKQAEGGHLAWTGTRTYDGTPVVRYSGHLQSAYRIAFTIRHGRDPEGHVRPGCDHDGCVHPDHVEDRPMRQRNRAAFAAIFGQVTS